MVIPQQVLAFLIMSLHATTYYLLHAASGRTNTTNNPKLLSVGSDMSLFGSLENTERSATENLNVCWNNYTTCRSKTMTQVLCCQCISN